MITDRTSEVEFEKKKNALIMDVEEAERKILSRELHDGIAQNHILMHLLIETLPITEDVRMQLKPVEDVIKKSLEETISISYRLNPPDLRDGLEAGLVSLIQNVNSTGILSCSLAFDCEILEMDLQTTEILNIYRIVQEFINNSIKYSGCKTIEIVFQRRDENEIYLLIKDDGKGFDKINHKSKGLGTENIMHRLEILNFKGLYESEVGKGTWIEGVFCLNDLVFSHD